METLQTYDQMSAVSILKLFETNKEQRESFVMDLVNRIDAGEADPLEVHLQMKSLEDIIKLANSNTVYKSAVLGAAEKYGAKSFAFHNAKVEIKEVGTKYDFSKCEDSGLETLYKQKEELDAVIKKREGLLKSVPAKGMIITDEDTGETYTVFPPAKSSSTSVAITLK